MWKAICSLESYPTKIFKSSNIALIIESSIEKTPVSGTWIKSFDSFGLIINCSKLKVMEEKIWLKRQLDFLPKDLLPVFGGSIFQNNEANLLGQKNEVALLKLLFLSKDSFLASVLSELIISLTNSSSEVSVLSLIHI